MMAPLIQWPKSRFGSGPASRELVDNVEVGKETECGSVAVPVNACQCQCHDNACQCLSMPVNVNA